MRQSHVLALGAGIAVFGGGAAWLVEKLSSQPAASPLLAKMEIVSDDDSRLGQLQAQIERLGQQLAAQQLEMERLSHNQNVTDRPGGKPGESGGAVQVSEEEQALSEQRRLESSLSELEAVFASQAEDPRWSRTAEGQIAAAVGQVSEESGKDIGELPQLQDADCRTSLCRLALTHTDEAAVERFMQAFPHRLSWRQAHGRVQLVHNADGSVSSVVYLSREGHSLYENDQLPGAGPDLAGSNYLDRDR